MVISIMMLKISRKSNEHEVKDPEHIDSRILMLEGNPSENQRAQGELVLGNKARVEGDWTCCRRVLVLGLLSSPFLMVLA